MEPNKEKNPFAVALGKMKTEKKTASSRKNLEKARESRWLNKRTVQLGDAPQEIPPLQS